MIDFITINGETHIAFHEIFYGLLHLFSISLFLISFIVLIISLLRYIKGAKFNWKLVIFSIVGCLVGLFIFLWLILGDAYITPSSSNF
jgi:hypothetical protein